MNTIRSLILALVILALASSPIPAAAEGETGWGEILNPDGSIRLDLLTDLGTASEPAGWLNISRAKAYHLMQLGIIPTVRFGWTVRVRECDLEEYIRRSWSGWKQV